MIFAEWDAPSWALLVTAAVAALSGAICQVITLVFSLVESMRQKDRDAAAAAKVDKVAEKLETTTTATTEKLDDIAKTGEVAASVGQTVFHLVNNDMHIVLTEAAETSEALAKSTGLPEHIARAGINRQKLAEHIAKQKIVNELPAAVPKEAKDVPRSGAIPDQGKGGKA